MKLATKDELSFRLLNESHQVFDAAEDIYMPKSLKKKPKRVTKDQLASALVMIAHIKQILKIRDE